MPQSKLGAEIRVVHGRGDYFEIGIRNHYIGVDQPHENGNDLGPTPAELFVASIAACAALYARRFLARHQLDDHVIVRASWRLGDVPARMTSLHLDVFAPSLTSELYDRCVASVSRCTLKNTLENPPPIVIGLRHVPSAEDVTRAS